MLENNTHPGEVMSDITLSNLTVLVVEPSSMQRRLITDALYAAGINDITEVVNGADALDHSKHSDIDLLVSALYLPDMDGSDLIQQLRSDEVTQDTAFVLISSESRFEYLDPIKQAGAAAILSKPFTEEELSMALNATLRLVDEAVLEAADYAPEDLLVMLVDDSPMARRHIKRVLSNMGFERFVEADNGIEAMAALQNQFFDLVVTDYNMPLMDGSALVDRIRNDSNQPSVPIMMVTSEQDSSRLAAVQKSGVSAICDKPFEHDTVRQLMTRILSNQV